MQTFAGGFAAASQFAEFFKESVKPTGLLEIEGVEFGEFGFDAKSGAGHRQRQHQIGVVGAVESLSEQKGMNLPRFFNHLKNNTLP